MNLPNKIASGFNFDEAVCMAELTRRSYKIFEDEADTNVCTLYNALYNDDWHFVHVITDYQTDGRCLILRRTKPEQIALVFRGSVLTSEGFSLTNLGQDLDSKLVKYSSLPREKTPPPYDARIHRGFQNTFNAFLDEIVFFFEILVGSKLERKLLVDLVSVDIVEIDSRIRAMEAALALKLGANVASRVARTVSHTVLKIKAYELDIRDIDLDKLVSEAIQETKKATADAARAGTERDHFEAIPNLDIYVTGHSLGGALAALCALHLKRYFGTQNDFPPTTLKVYTIGSPKVGNKEFADYFNKQLSEYGYRIYNGLDPAVYAFGASAPLLYKLPLMLPGVDRIRNGDDYYGYFHHVGEPYALWGLGHQKLDLDFGGPLKLTVPLPFPHGPDGYKEMLINAQHRQAKFVKPFRGVIDVLLSHQDERLTKLQTQIEQLQEGVAHLQRQIDPDAKSDTKREATQRDE